MPALTTEARRHVENDRSFNDHTDTYGEPDPYTAFDCRYCDETFTATHGLPEEWRDTSDTIVKHVRRNHPGRV